jgi:hypothetical protein
VFREAALRFVMGWLIRSADVMTNAEQIRVGVMKKMGLAAIPIFLVSAMMWTTERAVAQSPSAGMKVAQAVPQQWPPSPRRQTPRLRVTPYPQQGVIPHYDPGPDAVRVCNAHYEQEYRPSGTVIVPRMYCYWTRDPRARALAD